MYDVKKRRAIKMRAVLHWDFPRRAKTESLSHLLGSRMKDGALISVMKSVKFAKSSGFTNRSGLNNRNKVTSNAMAMTPVENRTFFILLTWKKLERKRESAAPRFTGMIENAAKRIRADP